MLNCAKKDLGLKRKVPVDMEKSDNEMSEAITKVNKTMESIGDSLKHGVALMAEVMKQTQAPPANFFSPQFITDNYQPQTQANQTMMPNYFGQSACQTPYQVSQPNRMPFANSLDDKTSQSSYAEQITVVLFHFTRQYDYYEGIAAVFIVVMVNTFSGTFWT